jgi:membrane-bound lytic murein transglycosylase F
MRKKISDWMFRLVMGVFPIAAAVALPGYGQPPTTLERIVRGGELLVVTQAGPTTYYEDGQGAAGFEYDLAHMFAEHLGVELRLVVPEQPEDILPMIARREAHLAAAGLSATAEHMEQVRFGPAYHEATQQLVYRSGAKRPASLREISGEVMSGARHAALVEDLVAEHPGIDWRTAPGLESGDLLAKLWQKEVPFIVADSNEVKISQRYYPELRVAFDLNEPQPLAWAFSHGRDDSLLRAAETFFEQIRNNGQLEQLRERYYGHVDNFDYVGVRRFLRHVDQRLPKYAATFREAATEHGHDWRLLAAVGYQESLWNPKAVSPTGVRGIMMLTNRTASELGIEDRIDPGNSIRGGARYLDQILKRLPAHIEEPDRTWLALAAYNVGYGHLEDARTLTRMRGGNPDRWMDVKENLPLLTQKQWYKDTRYGYARGHEAVAYVQNIRSHYDMLVWQGKRRTAPVQQQPETTIAVSTPPQHTALHQTAALPSRL